MHLVSSTATDKTRPSHCISECVHHKPSNIQAMLIVTHYCPNPSCPRPELAHDQARPTSTGRTCTSTNSQLYHAAITNFGQECRFVAAIHTCRWHREFYQQQADTRPMTIINIYPRHHHPPSAERPLMNSWQLSSNADFRHTAAIHSAMLPCSTAALLTPTSADGVNICCMPNIAKGTQ